MPKPQQAAASTPPRRFTKLHEIALCVLFPLLAMPVVEMTFHPEVVWFFVIGIPCLGAFIHLVVVYAKWRPARVPHIVPILVTSLAISLYVAAAVKAQRMQDARRIKQTEAEVFDGLEFLLPRTRELHTIDTAFKVINRSKHSVLAEPLQCTDVRGHIGLIDVTLGAIRYTDRPTRRVGHGGDVQSTTCLRPFSLAVSMPDYSVSCIDVTVRLTYYLDVNPLTTYTKLRRFWGFRSRDTFDWDEVPDSAPRDACGGKLGSR